MGLGRYAQAETVLDEGAAGDPDPQRPAYDYQFVLDCGFLDGRYGDTLARVNRLPDWVKVARPELAVTAMWSAIDAGDPLAFEHYISGTAMNKMAFEPDLFSGLSRFVAGDYGGAEVIFRAMQSSEYGARISDPGRWLVATLIREGKPSEARRIMDEVDAAFPTEHLQSSEIGLWLKWSEGQRTAALVAQFDDLVAKKRLEARTTVESRALLPITLARAAAVHHAAGQGTQAAKLSAEALRMAPAPWKTMLKEISSSR